MLLGRREVGTGAITSPRSGRGGGARSGPKHGERQSDPQTVA